MTYLRTAAQQALEALTNCTSEYGHRCNRCDSEVDEGGKVVEALRAALAAPVQEPVAWMVYTEGGTSAYVTDNPNDLVGGYRALALYTAPPQRKPLTEEEIHDCFQQRHRDKVVERRMIARAIERAHGIGENT